MFSTKFTNSNNSFVTAFHNNGGSGGSKDVINVLNLPSENIDTTAIYCLLQGKLYLKGLLRNDCNCKIVSWGDKNTGRPQVGENLIISETVGNAILDSGLNVYYNLDDDNLWGYFDSNSVSKIQKAIKEAYPEWQGSIILTIFNALIASNTWLSITQILSNLKSFLNFDWGGAVGDIKDIMNASQDKLFILLYSTLYSYKENIWTRQIELPCFSGEGKSSLIAGHINNIASGDMSAAFGNQTQVLGSSSIAAGYLSVARNNLCFAFGEGLDVDSGFAIGQYNEKKNNIVFSVGVGTSDTNRKNALDIQSLTGNINFYAPAIFNSSIQVKGYISFAALLSGEYRLVFESNSLCWQYWLGGNKGSSYKLITEGTLPSAFKSYYIQTGAKSSNNIEANSTAEGVNNIATGVVSHAEGAETQALGVTAHSEGYSTQALADYSHAEGLSTEARGVVSHAEGGETIAEGPYSHAEGQGCSTTAEALWAHAEGVNTVALAMATHAEGNGTIAASYCQHVQGQFNLVDEETKYAHIVGNGAKDENRSNAHTIDWNGNAWFAGAVLVGGESMNDENAELLITSGVITKLLNKLSEKGIEISIDELLS